MAVSLENYKGLQVLDAVPSGAGGKAIQDDLKYLVDWNPKSNWSATTDPTADDDSTNDIANPPTKNYQVGSLWYRTDTGVLFMCTDATPTLAVWKLVLVQPNTDKPLQADAGGNARGENATDLQRDRGADTQVASGVNAVIPGGSLNQAAGSHVTISGGRNNVSSNIYSTIVGGRNNRANADYSTVMGQNAKAELEGQVAHATGNFAVAGDAQASTLVARNETVGSTAAGGVELFLDGSSEQLVVSSSKTWAFSGLVTARRYDPVADEASAGWEIKGVIERFSSLTLVGSSVTALGNNSGGDLDLAVTADTGNSALKIAGINTGSGTVRWVAKVSLSEVAG